MYIYYYIQNFISDNCISVQLDPSVTHGYFVHKETVQPSNSQGAQDT